MISTLSKKHHFDIVLDSQGMYRLILKAMSNPARAVDIGQYADKLFGGHAALLAVAMTLLDNEVCFCAVRNSSLADDIATLTLAKREAAEHADFVFVSDVADVKSVLESVKYGTPADPHKSATVIIQDDGLPGCRLRLSGPGIDGHLEAAATQAVKDAILQRDAQGYEYPQGIDLIFTSGGGRLFAIPRLTRIEVL